MTFEQAMLELEQITRQLESGEIPLDDSLQLFEKGVELTRFCSNALEEAEQKIAILTQDNQGNMKAKLFSAEEGDEDESV
ncbi:MAG: exodeoxyribonuclease VII small subunit [Ruminococcaceae bacterium]|nr:exodeoxyribonuclease VII small subunit [Oscillospiraceae bacterium]